MAGRAYYFTSVLGEGGALSGVSALVKLYGTGTKATIYTSLSENFQAANPITTDNTGSIGFYAEPGTYEITFTDQTAPARISTYTVIWDSVSGAEGGVAAAQIEGSGITAAKIAEKAVSGGQVAVGQIINGTVQDGSITSAKIKDGSVDQSILAGTAEWPYFLATATEYSLNTATASSPSYSVEMFDEAGMVTVPTTEITFPNSGIWAVDVNFAYKGPEKSFTKNVTGLSYMEFTTKTKRKVIGESAESFVTQTGFNGSNVHYVGYLEAGTKLKPFFEIKSSSGTLAYKVTSSITGQQISG